jgi:hypothetical protein
MRMSRWLLSLTLIVSGMTGAVASVAEEPAGAEFSMQIEGSDLVSASPGVQPLSNYLTFTSSSDTTINFTYTTNSSVIFTLYRYQTEDELDSVDSLNLFDPINQNLPDEGFTSTASFEIEECQEQDPRLCSLFRLEVQAFAPPPYQEDFEEYVFHLFRVTPGQEADLYIDDEVYPVGGEGQRWVQLPELEELPTDDQIRTLGFENSSGQEVYSFGQYVPLFSDLDLYLLEDSEIQFRIFDNLFNLRLCSLNSWRFNPEGKLCLVEVFDFYQPFLRYPANQSFYLSLLSTCNYSDNLDSDIDPSCREIEIRWPQGSVNHSAKLIHFDQRYETFTQFTSLDPVTVEDGDPPRHETTITTSEACEDPLLDCTRVWRLEASYKASETQAPRELNLNFVIWEGIEYGTDQYGNPVIIDATQKELRFFQDSESEEFTSFEYGTNYPNYWVSFEAFKSLTPPKPGFKLVGWASDAYGDRGEILDPFIPLVANNGVNIYPKWAPIYSVNFYNGSNLVREFRKWGELQFSDFQVALPSGATHWATVPGGQAVASEDLVNQATNFYAVVPTPNQNNFVQEKEPQGSTSPSPNPAPSSPQAPPMEPTSATPKTKTGVKISFENGVTTVAASIPATYVNRGARIEQRVVVNGKVRYTTLGRAWTHFEKTTKDQSKAVMTFRFPKKLEATDRFRVVVRGVTVIKSFGDGKPAWK